MRKESRPQRGLLVGARHAGELARVEKERIALARTAGSYSLLFKSYEDSLWSCFGSDFCG